MDLYHYTSIESLVYILRDSNIKFNRLDLVNDPIDGISSDFLDSQKIMYVSCFTKREDDSIPMWSMYTNDLDGIRIKFNENLFGKATTDFWGHVPSRELSKKYFDHDETNVVIGPIEISYLDKIDEEHVSVIRDWGGKIRVFFPLIIGDTKLSDWKFEEEIRFKILSFNGMVAAKTDYDLKEKMQQVKDYIYEDKTNVLIDLDKDAFGGSEILLGPKVSEAQEEIVRALIEKFQPTVTVSRSEKQIR